MLETVLESIFLFPPLWMVFLIQEDMKAPSPLMTQAHMENDQEPFFNNAPLKPI